MPFVRNEDGELVAGEAQERQSAGAAESAARRMAETAAVRRFQWSSRRAPTEPLISEAAAEKVGPFVRLVAALSRVSAAEIRGPRRTADVAGRGFSISPCWTY